MDRGADGKVFYGWWIVAACFMTMFCTFGIVYNCNGMFIVPVTEDMGFTRQQMGMNSTIISSMMMIVSLFAGKIFKRFNVKMVMRVGAICLIAGYASYSLAQSLYMFYASSVLVGLGLAYPDILNVDGHLVISKDLANADRVTIVTYGGSGHEPAQAGFVGKGMLDIQAVGDIFAAPNGQLVFDAMKMADKGHGVLLLTLNYAGDQLAGKQAMKLARKAGLNVRQVVTGEEIRYDPNGEDNKRGLAGAVALYHIAAAAAREGKTLEEVAEIAQHYADNMASITVKSTDATHPQNGMSFGDLGETDLMEIGAGQHGEGGGVRVPMMSSKDTVATVAEALCKALDLKPGDKTFVMINGCGATTMMEMLVLFKDTVEFLKAKGIEVVASMVGEILTVQEAAGFQMNIAKWDEEMLRLWNTPCHTPAFSKE